MVVFEYWNDSSNTMYIYYILWLIEKDFVCWIVLVKGQKTKLVRVVDGLVLKENNASVVSSILFHFRP